MPTPHTQHIPVLPVEVLEQLTPLEGGVYIDGTLGGGGHARLLAEKIVPGGRLIGIDRDPLAVERTGAALADLPQVEVHHASYVDLPELLRDLGIVAVHGILLDLGLSSDQLADRKRGFSFASDGPLDLRFDPTRGEPASRLLGRLSAEHLADLIYQYGEERHSRRIARRIVERMRESPLESAEELAQIVRSAVPHPRGPKSRGTKSRGTKSRGTKSKGTRPTIDPATRTFQALRIAVNDELLGLEHALQRLPSLLAPGGRLVIITFHSLEDRLVKHAFRSDRRLEVLTRKPIQATAGETASNPRARSAKLRTAQRVPDEQC